MYVKCVFISILLLFLANISFSVQAVDYELELQEGDEFILEVKIIDENGLDKNVGRDWEDLLAKNANQIGNQMKTRITDTKEADINLGVGNVDGFIIKVDQWDWTDDPSEFKSAPDNEDIELKISHDPRDQIGVPNFAPLPVNDWLKNLEGDQVGIDWDTEKIQILDNSLILEVKMEEVVLVIWTYDSNTGALISFQIADNDNNILYQQSLASIAGYDLPLFIALSSIASLSIIYIFHRKR
ncbi:MAG: hypothetical protein ACTSR8_06355 [Promethearchaeota archaeon]